MDDLKKCGLYPLCFEPVFKFTLWGGTRLTSVFGRKPPQSELPVGEAWEIVDRPGDQSVVKNGPLAGWTLHDLMEGRGADLFGSDYRRGMRFPLFVKLLDTSTNLSIQVHPDQAYCASSGDGAEPKIEMWYILHVDGDAGLFAGIREDRTKEDFLREMNGKDGDLASVLQYYKVRPRDLFYINHGRLHSIGGGILLFELQLNSDTTFRVSDWNRTDAHGKKRPLHVEQAMKCIDFSHPQTASIVMDRPEQPQSVSYDLTASVKDPPFRIEELKIVLSLEESTVSADGFRTCHILTAPEKPFVLFTGETSIRIPSGGSCLVPASTGSYRLAPAEGERVTVLKSTAVRGVF